MDSSTLGGERISRYRIIERIGAGGMGEVYRAEDTRLGRWVALKLLPEGVSRDSEARARFEREARAASALEHPSICTIYDIDAAPDGRLFITMALYEGETLRERTSGGALSVPEALHVVRQVASGLERAHAHGIVHRDVKPSNVMLGPEGEVKIIDFGIAKLAGLDDLTREGSSVGTLDYMAPEQLDDGQVDARADVWGLGVLLYEMLTGSLPFRGKDARARMAAVLTTRPPPPSALRSGIPEWLDRLVLEMLMQDPRDRIPTMSVVLEGLAAHGPTRDAARVTRRVWWSRAVGAVAGAVVLGLGAFLTLGSGESRAPIESIAVLPFADIGSSADGGYLSEGLTASLIDRLSQIDDLRVVPRGVAAAFADSALAATGRALSVRALVTGSVGQVGGRLVVRAELIDVERLAQIWGAQFDRAPTDLLEVQDALVADIATQLRIELTSQDAQALAARSTQNPEAYRLYLLSRHHNLSLTPEAWERGRRYAEEAVRLDPGYALGWAALSDSHLTGVFLGLLPQAEGYAQARVTAERAVALDPQVAQAHVTLGYAQHHGDWDWPGSLATFERAVALDSTNADAWQGVSEVFTTLGRVEEAVAAAERAAALDPITPIHSMWLGAAYARAGRLDDALRAHRRALELEPNLAASLVAIPTIELRLGGGERALEELERVLEGLGVDPTTERSVALMMAYSDRTAEARDVMARVDGSQAPGASALAWAWIGETDRAFELLDRAVAARDPQLWWAKVDWRFEPLHDDPRWSGVLERMGLGPDEPRTVER